MKKVISIMFILLINSFLFADKATFVLKNGKTVAGNIVKIEAGVIDSKDLSEVSSINAAQGTNELLLQVKDVKEIVFKSVDDVSCFEDGRFIPIRKFCSMRAVYHVILKTPLKEKAPIELSDDRIFFFHVEGQKEPLIIFFSKIQASSQGREDKVDYPDLEREVMSFNKNGIKKITFN